MLAGGRAIEARAAAHAQQDLGALVGRAPRTVQRLDGDELRDIPADDVVPGDLLLVRPGEVLAVDGRVEGGAAVLDESALTGESRRGRTCRRGRGAKRRAQRRRPVRCAPPRPLLTRRMQESCDSCSSPRRRRHRSCGWPIGTAPCSSWRWPVAGLGLGGVRGPGPRGRGAGRGHPVSVDPPAPIAVVAGLSRAARFGVVVKGGAVLERLANGQVLLFDKTGTLTAGQPVVVAVHATGGADEREVVRVAASLDQVSPPRAGHRRRAGGPLARQPI